MSEKKKIKETISILSKIKNEILSIARNDLIKYGIYGPYVFEDTIVANRGMVYRYNSNYSSIIFKKLIDETKLTNSNLLCYLEKFESAVKDKDIFAIFIYWESGSGYGYTLYEYRRFVVGNKKRTLDFLQGGSVEWLV